ncbi:MAG: putative membrane-bound dehydrogenase-like protein [Psychromonas sp.]|jgi:putative membrane-bound dehydrogenase-like protein
MKYLLLVLTLSLSSWLFKGPGDDKMYVPDDLEVSLWAESPMFHNPTNMDVDARGRIWITEAVNYRDFNNKTEERLNSSEKGDRVVILEDVNQDGKADKSTVFAQDSLLVAPLGIAVFGNKVFVSCAPNVIVYTDLDGDDRADKKEIFLTGFGGFDHDHSLHSFIATPYGKLLFNTGNAGPHYVKDKNGWTLRSGSIYTGGTPYAKANKGNQKSDDGRVWVGGLALEIEQNATNLKVLGHNFRNSYEIAMDSYGNMWQNDNDDQVIACRVGYLMEGSNTGYFSKDGTRQWQGDRRPGQDIFSAHWHQEDPNVLPVGYKIGAGSPTGLMVYEGGSFGEKYQGMLLSCEAGRNVVLGYHTSKNGAGYDLEEFDFIGSLPSNDEHYIWNADFQNDKPKWFRPSDAVTGTDGAIYVADWYDPVVGGHKMDDKEAYGRIYRITPKGRKLKSPKLNFGTLEGLLKVIENPAVNVRLEAFNKIKLVGEPAVPQVLDLTLHKNPYVAARAIFLLSELGNSGIDHVKRILRNGFGDHQIAAARALRNKGFTLSELQEIDIKSVSSELQREVAISLRDLTYSESKDALMELAKSYLQKDDYLLNAIGIGIDSKAAQFFEDYAKTLPQDPLEISETEASILFTMNPVGGEAIFKARAGTPEIRPQLRKQAITSLAFVNTAKAAKYMIALSNSELTDVAEQAQYWVSFRKNNDWADLLDWEESEEVLLSANQRTMIALKESLLDESVEMELREKAAASLASDAYGGRLILNLAAANQLSKEMKSLINLYIFSNPDLSIRSMASDYFSLPGGQRLSMDLAVNMPGETEKGALIFKENCMTCHKVGENGADIGPDLTLIKKKFNKTGLLDAIMNPSASMAFGYEPWLVTSENNSYYGFIVADGKTLVLKDLTGNKVSIKSEKVSSKNQLKNSLMPDPASMGLKEKELADLSAYLLSI